jgi:hypothetical protein
MAAAARFVPAHEDVVGCVEEEDARLGAVAMEFVDRSGEVVEEVAGPDVDDERVRLRLLLSSRQLRDLADQRRGQVVDDEEAEVFQHVGRLGPPGTGHARDDRDVERPAHDGGIVARSSGWRCW